MKKYGAHIQKLCLIQFSVTFGKVKQIQTLGMISFECRMHKQHDIAPTLPGSFNEFQCPAHAYT